MPVKNLLEWSEWFEHADCSVAFTILGDVRISTVFLGIDHRYSDEETPKLFETMVDGGTLHGGRRRYATWEDAKKGHAEIVAQVTAALKASP